MPDWLYILIAVVYFALLAWALDADCRAERRFFAELKLRPPVTEAELVTRYFDSQMPPEIPVRIRRVLETQLGFPADRLLPDDDFLKPFGDLDYYEVGLEIAEEFDITIDVETLAKYPPTIRGLSELVAEKLNRQLEFSSRRDGPESTRSRRDRSNDHA